ncbi:MAG: AAA family ATPase, partial [Gemmatimonadota bacterium]
MGEATVREPDGRDLELLDRLAESRQALESEIGKRVIGEHRFVVGLIKALMADGDALLVGVTVLDKTLLISSLAEEL